MLMNKNVSNDVTMNPPIQSQHMKTFYQTMRLVFDMNSAENGGINSMPLKRRIVRYFWNFMN